MEQIKISDLRAIHDRLGNELRHAISEAVEGCHYVKGQAVTQFEQELATYLGCNGVVSCGNGTDALLSAIASLGLNDGDEIITTPFSFVAAVEAIALLRLTPVFADIDPKTFNINPENIERLITPRTKAIVPVHLYGRPCEMQKIMDIARRHNLYVVEDVAQALGAEVMVDGRMQKLGTIGDLGCTSFFPTKNLACMGDGGAVFGNNLDLLRRVRAYVNHGSERKYENTMVGINSRLDTIQAAVLRVKLRYLDQMNDRKRNVAQQYNDLLKNDSIVLPQIVPSHAFHLYVIRVLNGKRQELMDYLENQGIQTLIHYPKAIHNLAPYTKYVKEKLLHSDLAEQEVLSLPMHSELTKEKILYICDRINKWNG